MALIKTSAQGLTADATNLVLLNTVTTTDATVSDIDFDSTYITSTYENYVAFVNVAPATDNTQLRFRFFVNGSLKSGSSDYDIGYVDEGGGGTNSSDASYIRISQTGVGNASGEGVTTVVNLANVTSSTKPTTVSFNTQSRNTNGAHSMIVGGCMADYDLVNDGIRFYFSTGNFASGSTISLYGVKS